MTISKIDIDAADMIRFDFELIVSWGNLVVPRTRRRIGDRAFSVAAPRAWNKLPTELKLLRSTELFRRDLKTFLFHSVYTGTKIRYWLTLWCALSLLVGGGAQYKCLSYSYNQLQYFQVAKYSDTTSSWKSANNEFKELLNWLQFVSPIHRIYLSRLVETRQL